MFPTTCLSLPARLLCFSSPFPKFPRPSPALPAPHHLRPTRPDQREAYGREFVGGHCRISRPRGKIVTPRQQFWVFRGVFSSISRLSCVSRPLYFAMGCTRGNAKGSTGYQGLRNPQCLVNNTYVHPPKHKIFPPCLAVRETRFHGI